MFTGIRKAIVAGVLAGSAVLAGAGASSASARVVPAVPDDTGLELGWGITAAKRAGALDRPTVAQFRGRGLLYELRWGNAGPPVLVRIDAG
jgi:hypothetical protein